VPPSRTVRGNGVKESLKQFRDVTTSLVAVDEHGDETKIGIPEVRNKHARVTETLSKLSWVKVKFLDKRGDMIHLHERNADDEEPADELEELGKSTSGRGAELGAILQVACHWITKAQDMALQRQQQSMQSVFDGQNRMIESTIKRFEMLDRQYVDSAKMNHKLNGALVDVQLQQLKDAIEGAAAQASEDGEPVSADVMRQVLPMIIAKMFDKPADGKPSTPKNGKSKES
jgi:hypothetical protein